MKKYAIFVLSFLLPAMLLTACWSEAAVEEEYDGAAMLFAEENASDESESEEGDESEESTEASADGKHVTPIKVSIDMNSPQDGTYPAMFTADDIDLDAKEITLNLYSIDYYEAYQINMLQIGDVLNYDGRDMVVELIEDKSGSLYINGGLDKGGCELWPEEGDTYVAKRYDDYPTFSDHGKTTLSLSDSLTISDSHENPSKPKEADMEGLKDYLEGLSDNAKEYFMSNNTTIDIRGGKIVNITRIWVP